MSDLVQLATGLVVPAAVAFAEGAGRPLLREIAATGDGRDITRGYLDGLARRLPQDGLLLERGGGDYGLYRQVLSDIQVKAVLQQRWLGLTRTEWVVIPGGEKRTDKRAAAAIEETLKRIRWDAVCAGMQYGVFYGYAVAECLWGRDGSTITLDAVKVRDRRRFVFDGQLRLRLRTMRDSDGEILPERKFWVFCTGADHDDEPYGLGLAHWLYWPVLFKRANIKFWLIRGEKFGSPTALGIFPPAATPAEQRKLLATLQAIQTDAGIILPEGMSIELLESGRTGTSEYEALCRYMDGAIAKLVLGQVMTSEAVGGQYKAEVQDAVKDDIVKADADLLCDSFNRGPVRWLTDWNFPGAAYPTVWRQTEAPEDLNQRAERDTKIFQVGYKPTLAAIVETYGGEWEPTGGRPPEEAEQTAFGEPQRRDAQARIDAEAGRDPGWDAVMEPLLAPIFDALEGGLPPEDILGRMDEWYPAMDDAALVDLLTRAITAAETLGRLEVRDE